MAKEVLFDFLRAALWDVDVNGNGNVNGNNRNAQWDEVLAVAEQQTVTPLVLQALERAQVELSREGRRRMLIYTQKSVKHNRKLNQEIGALVTLFRQHDIDYVVVKGQVLASYYAHPVLRQGGDIDFYCDTENFKKAHDIIRQEWEIEEHHSDPGFHESFDCNGVDFEMHYSLAHFYDKKKDAYWEQLLNETSPIEVEVEGVKIKTLHPTLHSLYVFLHLWHHLLELGVGLRQFCDWAMILHSCKAEIDHQELRKHLKVFGLEKTYRACGCILVDKLGLPAADFPYELTAKDRKYSQRILDVVFYRGNMGLYNRVGGVRGWKHIVEATFVKVSHFMKFYPMAPGYMRDWGWNRVTQISRISQNS